MNIGGTGLKTRQVATQPGDWNPGNPCEDGLRRL